MIWEFAEQVPHKALSAPYIWSAAHDFGTIYAENYDMTFANYHFSVW